VSTAGAAEDQRRKAAFYRLANSVAMRGRSWLSLRRRKAELNFGRWFNDSFPELARAGGWCNADLAPSG